MAAEAAVTFNNAWSGDEWELPVGLLVDPEYDCEGPYRWPLGSGQGIVEAFIGQKPVGPSGSKGSHRTVRAQVRSNLLLSTDEGNDLVKTCADSNSIVGEVLRALWAGDVRARCRCHLLGCDKDWRPTTMTCSADPNDVAACAIDGCTYTDPEGNLARGGFRELREFLTAEPEAPGSDGRGCGCRHCTGFERPFSAQDADMALAHVPPRVATLFLLGKAKLSGSVECEDCDVIVPWFTDAPGSTDGVIARRRCPNHDHLLRAV